MWLESVSQSANHAETCPTCGGGVQRRVYGEMHGGTFIQDGRRVDISGTPPEGFRDPVMLDPLTQYFDGTLYRQWPSSRYFTRGGSYLHLDVWVTVFGERHPECHIHHRDGNVHNNALSNLECMPKGEHLKLSWQERAAKLPDDHEWFTSEARDRAAEWHASEEGRLWHRRHAKTTRGWTKWQREERPCPFCSKLFMCLVRGNASSQIYCSEACKVAAYRKRKKDAENLKRQEQICPVCNGPVQPVTANKPSPRIYCSDVCCRTEMERRHAAKRKAARHDRGLKRKESHLQS